MRRSKILLVAVIIGVISLAYTWSYIYNSVDGLFMESSYSARSLGTSIAVMLVLPHQVLATLGLLFSIIGYAANRRWGALVAGILYSVALVAMPAWFYFVVLQLILCYVAYAKMPRMARRYVIDDYDYDYDNYGYNSDETTDEGAEEKEAENWERRPRYRRRVITETNVLHDPEEYRGREEER